MEEHSARVVLFYYLCAMEKGRLEEYISRGTSLRKIAIAESTSLTNVRYWINKHNLLSAFNPFSGNKADYKCKCGQTDPNKFYGHKKQICSDCQNRYNVDKARESKQLAIGYLGGSCNRCGYSRCNAALDIHHKDPEIKDLNFKTSRFWNRERLIKELEGCELLCKNCHAELHYPNI